MGIKTEWAVVEINDELHCFPLNDDFTHYPEDCNCNPELARQPSGQYMWVHNSFDGREEFETGERLPS